MDPVDQLALMVGLAEFHFELVSCGGGAGERLDVLERRAAIGLRLACAEQIEVRAVEDKEDFRHEATGRGVRCRPRFIGTPHEKGRPLARTGSGCPAFPSMTRAACAGPLAAGLTACLAAAGHVARSLSVASPTAPITASPPIT